LFAEAKDWLDLRRFRLHLQGLENVNIEGLLAAAGQNLKRFLAATGRASATARAVARGPPGSAAEALARRCLTRPIRDEGPSSGSNPVLLTVLPEAGDFFNTLGGYWKNMT
jgi:hypothetical protein